MPRNGGEKLNGCNTMFFIKKDDVPVIDGMMSYMVKLFVVCDHKKMKSTAQN